MSSETAALVSAVTAAFARRKGTSRAAASGACSASIAAVGGGMRARTGPLGPSCHSERRARKVARLVSVLVGRCAKRFQISVASRGSLAVLRETSVAGSWVISGSSSSTAPATYESKTGRHRSGDTRPIQNFTDGALSASAVSSGPRKDGPTSEPERSHRRVLIMARRGSSSISRSATTICTSIVAPSGIGTTIRSARRRGAASADASDAASTAAATGGASGDVVASDARLSAWMTLVGSQRESDRPNHPLSLADSHPSASRSISDAQWQLQKFPVSPSPLPKLRLAHRNHDRMAPRSRIVTNRSLSRWGKRRTENRARETSTFFERFVRLSTENAACSVSLGVHFSPVTARWTDGEVGGDHAVRGAHRTPAPPRRARGSRRDTEIA